MSGRNAGSRNGDVKTSVYVTDMMLTLNLNSANFGKINVLSTFLRFNQLFLMDLII